MAKKSPSRQDEASQPMAFRPFEESLAELQAIVDELEDGSLGLDDSMKRFETGIALLRECSQTLDRAEQRIEILTGFDAEGNPMTEPFDSSATAKPDGRPSAGRRGGRRTARQPGDDVEEE